MNQGKTASNGYELHRIADQDYANGDVVQAAGLGGIVQGLRGVLAGDPMSVAIKGVFDVTCDAATTFADGAEVFWNTNTDRAVTAAGAGIFRLGRADGEKTVDSTTVRVLLNE